MRVERGVSQVLFGFLPDQTADLEGEVYRVLRWADPYVISVDAQTVRQELLRAVYPWTDAGTDNDLSEALWQGVDLHIVSPSERGGVEVERFPEVYRCKRCNRVRYSDDQPCRCGTRQWAQLHFVAFHKCGRLDRPWIKKCPQHDQVAVRFSGTSTTRDLRFYCPVCDETIMKGFPYLSCDCGDGTLEYNVHRAAVVYVPRTAVIVNPPDPETAARYQSAAGAELTLAWVLDGMQEDDPTRGRPTVESIAASFRSQGINEERAWAMAEAAAGEADGAVADAPAVQHELNGEDETRAQEAALRLAYSAAGKRLGMQDLMEEAGPAARVRYEHAYQSAIADARLSSVELLQEFPVLTACFGYTRGDTEPGASTLRWFKSNQGDIRLHGYRADTEGLLFQLRPTTVAAWMHRRGHLSTLPEDDRAARIRLLTLGEIPQRGDQMAEGTASGELLTLVHSYAHRVMRTISAFCGIERLSLAEYLIPEHLSFVVYASLRGDFVLGGLQALFEHDLDKALREVVEGERRCALDPGCRRHGAACAVCLHVGEPSCRYFNQFLTRNVLFGTDGYFDFDPEQ